MTPGEKLYNALKNETLMKKVGQLASNEQKSIMKQSTVEERFKKEFCIDNGPDIEDSIKDTNGSAGPILQFIKSELKFAEQKAREELKKVIIEKGIDLIDIEQDINLI